MLIQSSQSTQTLAVTFLLAVGTISHIAAGAPYRQPQTEGYSSDVSSNLAANYVNEQPTNGHLKRSLSEEEGLEEQGEIEAYNIKQPSTPPDSLASDQFSFYKYEQSLEASTLDSTRSRRTIIVGDIHGSLAGFERFLNQIGFTQKNDAVILVGDLVAKGPQSLQVIDKARAINARCVRGNHDDKVIRWKGYLDSLNTTQRIALGTEYNDDPDSEYDVNQSPPSSFAKSAPIPSDLIMGSDHYYIANNMTLEQYQYLLSCPLILSIPSELSVRKIPIHIIHAGIDPESDIESQLPWVLVNIRNILKDGVPSRKTGKGHGWAREFNDLQSERTANGQPGFMLVYGHDAGRSLNVKPWSIGLDSGCVYGGALSGYIVETGQIISIPCSES